MQPVAAAILRGLFSDKSTWLVQWDTEDSHITQVQNEFFPFPDLFRIDLPGDNIRIGRLLFHKSADIIWARSVGRGKAAEEGRGLGARVGRK